MDIAEPPAARSPNRSLARLLRGPSTGLRLYLSFCAVAVGVAAGAFAYLAQRLHDEIVDSSLIQGAAYARLFESHFTQTLNLVGMTLANVEEEVREHLPLALGVNGRPVDGDRLALRNTLQVALRNAPFIRSVSVVDEGGRIIESTDPRNVNAMVDVAAMLPRDGAQRIPLRVGIPLAARDFHLEGKGGGLSFFPVLRPVGGVGKLSLVASVNPDYFLNLVDEKLGATAGVLDVMLFDGAQLFSSRSDRPTGGRVLSWLAEVVSYGEASGAWRGTGPDGQPVLVAYRASPLFPAVVAVSLDEATVLAPWHRDLLKNGLTNAGVLGVILLLATVIFQRERRGAQQRAEATAALQVSEERLKLALHGGSLGLWDWDVSAATVTVNAHWGGMLNLDSDSRTVTLGVWQSLVHPDDLARVEALLQDHVAGRTPVYEAEYRMHHRLGYWVWIYSRGCAVVRDAQGLALRVVGTHLDITQRREAEERLRLAASVFAEAHDGISITDREGVVVDVNPAFAQITGYSREEIVGQTNRLLKSGRHPPDFYRALWEQLEKEGHWRGEIWNRRRNGELYPELLTISAVRDEAGRTSHYIGVFSDITLLMAQQQRLERLAHYDPLTQLPNRILLADRLQVALAQAARCNGRVVVAFLDLDDFKPINDGLGHDVGDGVLVEVASRLLRALRSGDTVARLGGDEFIMALRVEDEVEAEYIARRALESVATPIVCGEHTVSVSGSMGLAMYPMDADQPDALVRLADQAMYEAKSRGRNRYCWFHRMALLEGGLSGDITRLPN